MDRKLTKALCWVLAGLVWGATGNLARGAIITFDPLVGIPTDTPYVGHMEAGFTVTPTTGNWFVAQLYGNPVPDIYAGPIGNPTTSTIRVVGNTAATATFNYAAVDLSTNNGPSNYTVQGFLGGNLVFSQTGTDNAITQFVTIPSTNPNVLVDALTIQVVPGPGVTSVNLDNINVPAPAPEPATLTLAVIAGGGMIGFTWRRRKA
jgi:hypothetical protein